ncbi:MAG: hypothetical protein Q7S09_03060 [bacterium]|nr:hypothetical protein [bacterium]
MNCNNCGVVIKRAGEECWSCGKMVDPFLQTLAPEPPATFSAPSPLSPQLTQEHADFGVRLASRAPTLTGGESDTSALDQVNQRKLEKKVRNAFIAAVLAGLVMLGAVVTGYIESYAAVDAFIILALAYGIYRRNLASAIALIAYLVGNKIYVFLTTPEMLSGGNLAVNGLLVVYLIDGAIAIRTLRSSQQISK